tara:strand:- start:368 stop:646 length:279 start_codon:yes stop_codon:yes gene_type:complete
MEEKRFALMMRASDGSPCFVMPDGERRAAGSENPQPFTEWAFCYRSEEDAAKAHRVVLEIYETTPPDFVWPSWEYLKQLKQRIASAYIVRGL